MAVCCQGWGLIHCWELGETDGTLSKEGDVVIPTSIALILTIFTFRWRLLGNVTQFWLLAHQMRRSFSNCSHLSLSKHY